MRNISELFRRRHLEPAPAGPADPLAGIDVEAVAAQARAMYNPRESERQFSLDPNAANVAMIQGFYPGAVVISRRRPTGEYAIDVGNIAAQHELRKSLATDPASVLELACKFYGEKVTHLGPENFVALADYKLGKIGTRRQQQRQLRSGYLGGKIQNLAEDAAGAAIRSAGTAVQAALGLVRGTSKT